MSDNRPIPWPWNSLETLAPVNFDQVKGKKCRLIRPGDRDIEVIVPGRVTFVADENSRFLGVVEEDENTIEKIHQSNMKSNQQQ